jgi:predicted O-methyltransferase YrrM
MLTLWKKDYLVIAGTGGGGVLAAAVAIELGLPATLAALAMVSAAGTAVILEVYRRLQVQMKEAQRDERAYQADTYHQIEALLSIVHTIKPTFPLPPTRTWSASPDILNHLCRLVLERRPLMVLETGSGVSTLVIAHCLRRLGRGRIVSLDHDAAFANVTRELLALHEVSDLATVVDAPLLEQRIGTETWLWYDAHRIPATGPVDLLFVDGPPWQTQPLARYPALPLLSSRLSPSAVVLLDDAGRADERTIAQRWCREFNLSSQYLPTEKGAQLFTMPLGTATPSGSAAYVHDPQEVAGRWPA